METHQAVYPAVLVFTFYTDNPPSLLRFPSPFLDYSNITIQLPILLSHRCCLFSPMLPTWSLHDLHYLFRHLDPRHTLMHFPYKPTGPYVLKAWQLWTKRRQWQKSDFCGTTIQRPRFCLLPQLTVSSSKFLQATGDKLRFRSESGFRQPKILRA